MSVSRAPALISLLLLGPDFVSFTLVVVVGAVVVVVTVVVELWWLLILVRVSIATSTCDKS